MKTRMSDIKVNLPMPHVEQATLHGKCVNDSLLSVKQILLSEERKCQSRQQLLEVTKY